MRPTADRPFVVGILNLTPDSFSDGGTLPSAAALLERARTQWAGGAKMLDLGAESTRPGFCAVAAEVQVARLLPAIALLRQALPDVALSVDTRDAAVARACLAAGASMINDVGGLADPAMAQAAAEAGADLVIMHGCVAPAAARASASEVGFASASAAESGPARHRLRAVERYGLEVTDTCPDVLAKLTAFFVAARDTAMAVGVPKDRIWLDPGLGFNKSDRQNWWLTQHLSSFRRLGCRVYYGPSRKRFLGAAVGASSPLARDEATAAVCAIAVAQGADAVRVHAPAAVRDAVQVGWAARSATDSEG